MNESTRITKQMIATETNTETLTAIAEELALRAYYLVSNRRGDFEALCDRSDYKSLQARWEMANDKLDNNLDWGDMIA